MSASPREASRDGLAGLAADLARFEAAPAWAVAQEIVEALPLALCADLAILCVRERRPAGRLCVVAASGLSSRELGRLAFSPLSVTEARALLASLPDNAFGRELGLLWGAGRLLRDDEAAGMLLVGSRTRRTPGPAELRLLDVAAARLAAGIGKLDASDAVLRHRAAELARRRGLDAARPGAQPRLRSREVQILELYGEGLRTDEIAELLVISPHTVRTHVRNALKGLGVRSRTEAVARLRERQVAAFVGEDGGGPAS
ncbi:MAG TPA: LuxR C-terminal-related transcriptional regulator [Gaiellaceae bacterium]|nr:LuxR C-terminal-related transcriptional regulator [Gaiellaceae bacterium]